MFNNQHSNEMARQGQADHGKPTVLSDAHYLGASMQDIVLLSFAKLPKLEAKKLRILAIFGTQNWCSPSNSATTNDLRPLIAQLYTTHYALSTDI